MRKGWGWEGVLLWFTSQTAIPFLIHISLILTKMISDCDPSNVTNASSNGETNAAAVPDGMDRSEDSFLHHVIVGITNYILCSLAAGGGEHGDQKANHRNDETSE